MFEIILVFKLKVRRYLNCSLFFLIDKIRFRTQKDVELGENKKGEEELKWAEGIKK